MIKMKAGESVREFEHSHALRILQYEETHKRKNWEIQPPHKYEDGKIVKIASGNADKNTNNKKTPTK